MSNPVDLFNDPISVPEKSPPLRQNRDVGRQCQGAHLIMGAGTADRRQAYGIPSRTVQTYSLNIRSVMAPTRLTTVGHWRSSF
jgi:hypothetical protein